MSSPQESVDVVIPVFNGRDTIANAIASVIAQPTPLVNKIIVIDDGSTDGTGDEVKALGYEKLQLVHTANKGVAAARNLGIELTSAQWVAFIDADDIWEKNKLELQLAAAQDTSIGFICGTVNGRSVVASGYINACSLWRGNFVATSSVIVRRKILIQAAPIFRTDMKFAEDYLAWLKCLILTNGYYVETNLVTYHLSERPRYNWGQIVRNLVVLNISWLRFVWHTKCSLSKKLLLPFCLLAGSLFSLVSIMKRFLREQ